MPGERSLRTIFLGLTVAMTFLGTAAAEIALAPPDRPLLLSFAVALGLIVPVGLVLGWTRSAAAEPAGADSGGEGARFEPWRIAGLIGLFVAPMALEGLRWAVQHVGSTLEIVLLASLRNLGLGLCALAWRRTYARLSALVSVFVVLFASTISDGGLILVLFSAHAVAGSLWLMMAYWSGLRLPATTGRRAVPWSAGLFLGLILAGGVVMVIAGPSRTAALLAELLPSSGGTRWNNSEARGGVNDGDNEVRGSTDPQSVGFTDSDLYLESDRPSLYDAINDMYGEPFKKEKFERMIALTPTNSIEQKERPSENLRAGRQFESVRKPRDPLAKKPGDRSAKALVYIQGPTPLHLPLAAFDRFDGRDWTESPTPPRSFALEQDGPRSDWLRSRAKKPRILAETVRHRIKIGKLDSSALPLPSHVDRLRIGGVDRPDFFDWRQDGILRIVDRTLPAGTTIDVESRPVDPSRLQTVDFRRDPVPDRSAVRVDPEVSRLAVAWGAGGTPGWNQIQRVVDRLRAHATVDPQATLPEQTSDAVAHFLLHSRCGPDYLFASAAVVLLRSLGYSSRLVSGFYGSPDRYDPVSRHTLVDAPDVHFWAEVQAIDGTWIAIEPTPGYTLREPTRSWLSRLAFGLSRLIEHPAESLVAVLLAGLAVWFRSIPMDALATLAWRLWPGSDPRRLAIRALALIDFRSRHAGARRPVWLTPRRWLLPLATDDDRNDLESLIRLAEWGLYDPRPGAASPREVRAICDRAIRRWTLGRFRRAAALSLPRSALP